MNQVWDWNFALEVCLPLLLQASVVTIQATIIAYLIALVVGLALALLRRSPIRLLAKVVGELIEFVRTTPILVQIYFIYFVGPQIGIDIAAWTAGMITLGLHYGTYTSEVYRAGLEGVDRGQWEAATALNLSTYRTYRDIVLPQAIPPIVPVLGNYLIGMFKETPLLSAISIIELMARAKLIGSDHFRYIEPITMVGVFFLIMSLAASALIQVVDRRLNRLPR
jgi:polar amino acid transport system permease protein